MELVTGVKGEPHITPLQDSMFFRAITGIDTGVFEYFNKFKGEITNNTTVTISTGIGTIQGRLFVNESPQAVTLEAGTAGFNRIDIITARYTVNSEMGTQEMNFYVITGTPSEGEATAPNIAEGSIDSGASPVDFPLYKVNFSGETLATIDSMIPRVISGTYQIGEEVVIEVPVSGWQESTTYTGYYENVIDRQTNTNRPHWAIAPADGALLPTDAELAAFNATQYLVGGDNLIFLSKSAIITTFYVCVSGVV